MACGGHASHDDAAPMTQFSLMSVAAQNRLLTGSLAPFTLSVALPVAGARQRGIEA